jgi:hypothetical protein
MRVGLCYSATRCEGSDDAKFFCFEVKSVLYSDSTTPSFESTHSCKVLLWTHKYTFHAACVKECI